MSSTNTAPTIVIRGRDTWTDSRLAKIERIVGAPLWATHYGNGDVRYTATMQYIPKKAEKVAILKAVQQIAPECRWQ